MNKDKKEDKGWFYRDENFWREYHMSVDAKRSMEDKFVETVAICIVILIVILSFGYAMAYL